MIETNVKELSVEEIMQKIKVEVENRKSTPFIELKTANTMVNKVDIIEKKENTFQIKEIYEYSDFTKFHDVRFIENIFRGLLKREFDKEGLNHYLNLLRSGEKSKSEIISIIRFSAEGRSKGVPLLGFNKKIIQATLYKIPVIGHITKSLVVLLTLPKLLKRLNRYECYVSQEAIMSSHNDLLLEEGINKITKELQISIDIKADVREVESIVKELQTSIDIKVDKINVKYRKYVKFKTENFLEKALTLTKHNLTLHELPLSNFYYSLFEDVFYEAKNVKEKQKIYLDYIKTITKTQFHLDIGCGRGEFLELLSENNLSFQAIDINKVEIDRLKKMSFNVELANLEIFFNDKKLNNSFSSVSALQVVEHLDINKIKIFLKNLYNSIIIDGCVIIETVNPHSPFAFGGFYMDETHIRPIPPEQLTFMMQWYGFKDIEIIYSSPLPKEYFSFEIKRNYYDYTLIGYKR